MSKTKNLISLLVGTGVALALNETEVTEKLSELNHWNQTMGLEMGKEYAVPIGKWVYNTTAGLLSAGATYLGLKKITE